MQLNSNTVAMVYGGVLHLAGLACVTVLVATHAIPSDVGMPILGGLLGIGVGAGVAVIQPGQTSVPSAGPAQPVGAATVAPAPAPAQLVTEAPTAPVAPVQAVTAVSTPAPGA